jgi:hypothetical protein
VTVSIDAAEIRLQGRGLLRRFGPNDVLPIDHVADAQAVRGRFGGGIALNLHRGEPWYIFTFDPDPILGALRMARVNVLDGVRRLRVSDEM